MSAYLDLREQSVRAMERQRLREEQPRPDTTDDEILEAVLTLRRRYERYDRAMQELIEELMITKGETLAITLGIPFPPED